MLGAIDMKPLLVLGIWASLIYEQAVQIPIANVVFQSGGVILLYNEEERWERTETCVFLL